MWKKHSTNGQATYGIITRHMRFDVGQKRQLRHAQDYLILLTAFPRHHWSRERASISHYTNIACLLPHPPIVETCYVSKSVQSQVFL